MPTKSKTGWTVNISGKQIEITQDEVVRHSEKLIGQVVKKNYQPDDLYLVQLASLKSQGALGEG